jgi:hypothetical protein
MISFYSNNLIHDSLITASSENELFPLSNLTDPRRTKVYRSLTSSASIVFDFGEAKEIDSVFFVDNSLASFGITAAQIELNSVNEWEAPLASYAVSINHSQGVGFLKFPLGSFQFLRINLSSNNEFCELSKIFIGKEITFANGMGIDFGWTYQDKDLSTIKENRYGQKFIDVVTRQKQISFSIRSMNKDELDQVMEVYDSKGITDPFFVKIGCDEMVNDKDRFAGMFYLSSIPVITNKSFGLYDISMNLEEAM